MKICNVCKVNKPLEGFHKCSSFSDGYVYTCKDCAKARTQVWNKENKERKTAQGKKHYEENKDVYKERAARLGWANKNKKKVNEQARKRYRKNNGAALSAFKRASRKRACPDWITETQKKAIQDMYWLAKDLRATSGEEYHVDHIVPLNGKEVCGLHVPWNLQVLPADQNIRKSNKLLDTKEKE